jgi:hypothetical protein
VKPALDHAKALRIISRAWGKQDGYAFFPHIDREEQVRSGERRAGFHENRAFKWPQEKAAILKHMEAHETHDLYWCPSLFEGTERKTELAMDEHALWADLDEANPKKLHGETDFKPTIAWETSPGRYQGLWVGNPVMGDFQGVSWPGNENQRLSYHLGADKSGWDTTQLLRFPGWPNYKPEYKKRGQPAPGKLLWDRGPMYSIEDFKELPAVAGALTADKLGDILTDEIDAVDITKVKARVKLKLNQRARDLLGARHVAGDRSENLWYLIRCLADAGCTVQEIVAIARASVWNKFDGRSDEIKRLITEAMKAIDQRDPEVSEKIEEEEAPKNRPSRIAAFLKDVKPPRWLVEGIATEGSVGFIAGQPKSFKSWFGLDLAISVATGAMFLDYFRVVKPGPVLYIQEEDSAITVKSRVRKVWNSKTVDRMRLHTNGHDVIWEPGNSRNFDPDIDIYLQEGFIVSEGHWQEWLDETLTAGMDGVPYVLVIIDTLMNVAGDVEENKSQSMTTKIFKPVKLLCRKHAVSLRFIHHMGKGGGDNDTRRGGQKMLGGTANHAWAEDSLYLSRGKTGTIHMEFESKSAPEKQYTISGLDNRGWTPYFEPEKPKKEPVPTSRGRKPRTARTNPTLDLLQQGGTLHTNDIATQLNRQYGPTYKSLRALEAQGKAHRTVNGWQAT